MIYKWQNEVGKNRKFIINNITLVYRIIYWV